MHWSIVILCTIFLAAVASFVLYLLVRRWSPGTWLPQYVRDRAMRFVPGDDQPVHLLLCIADHFEPGNGAASAMTADARVSHWVQTYPKLFNQFRDCDGRPPQHSFFYPLEQYDPSHVDSLARLCADGFGEVEVHLHHDGDVAENMRRRLLEYKALLANRHGLLSRRRDTGEIAYGFIHGNWALNNSRPDGRCCGIDNELDVLRETGCYADFTMPSAPDPTQTRQINSIYYACGDSSRRKAHDTGIPVGAGKAPARGLMLIQGPLLFNWRRRKWRFLPRVENGCIQGSQPATADRVNLWLAARVQVPTRPDWFFVKLHTHGAPEENQNVLLGRDMTEFHRELARRADHNPNFRFHYVTAREMYNLARAAEAGWRGSVNDARDFELTPPPGLPAVPVVLSQPVLVDVANL